MTVVDHSDHYNQAETECIDVIEALGLNFSFGSALKYLWRADLKGDPITDLEKAKWYIQREIERRQGERKSESRPTLPAGLDEITRMLDAGYNIHITRAGTSVVGVYVRNERQLCMAHGHHPGLVAAIEAAYRKTPEAHEALVANLREAIE